MATHRDLYGGTLAVILPGHDSPHLKAGEVVTVLGPEMSRGRNYVQVVRAKGLPMPVGKDGRPVGRCGLAPQFVRPVRPGDVVKV